MLFKYASIRIYGILHRRLLLILAERCDVLAATIFRFWKTPKNQ